MLASSINTFIEEDAIFREEKHVRAAARQAANFHCDVCSHNVPDAKGEKKIYPPFREDVPENSKGSATAIDRTAKPKVFFKLPSVVYFKQNLIL
jgi:hypothetical protein